MSAFAVPQDDNSRQIIGLTVRCARKLINRDWSGKLKKNVRGMIRWYSQEMNSGSDHWLALKLAKGRMKCPTARKEFYAVMTQARANARAQAMHPTRMLLPIE